MNGEQLLAAATQSLKMQEGTAYELNHPISICFDCSACVCQCEPMTLKIHY